MEIIVMKDSDLIVDFGDLGESQATLTSQGRYNATYHDFVTATPTYPSNPTTFRASTDWTDQEAWYWDSGSNSFVIPKIMTGCQHYTHGHKTRSDMLDISSPKIGDTVWCTTYNRMFWWSGNTWQCDQTIEGINNSGFTIYEGDVVVPSAVVDDAYVTTTTAYHPSVSGVVVVGASNGNWMTIAVQGIWKVFVYGLLNEGEHLATYSTHGNAQGVGGPPASVSGQFATAKEDKTASPVATIKAQIGILAHY